MVLSSPLRKRRTSSRVRATLVSGSEARRTRRQKAMRVFGGEARMSKEGDGAAEDEEEGSSAKPAREEGQWGSARLRGGQRN